MTWYFDPSGTTLDVYDHTGSKVASNREFSGVWSNFPDEVLTVMQEEAEDAVANNDTTRALYCVAYAAFEDIEEGTP